MAYRFNPPPNWPIEDAGWSPPPGWQPDPSWGPAPEGWNFWVADEQPPAAPGDSGPAAGEDDATRVVATGEQVPAAADPADDATHVASSGAQGTDEPLAEEPLGAEQPAAQEQVASQAPVGQYGAMNPYGAAPQAAAPAAQDSHGRDAAAPEDDATHMADSGQHAAVEDSPEPGGAPLAAGTGSQAGEGVAEEPSAPSHGTSETAEYQGPDLEAGLAQQAPYESAEPATEGHDAPPAQDGRSGQESGVGYGTAAAAGAAAAGGVAAGAAAHGAGAPDQQGYGQASPAPGYGQGSPAPGYGQGSPAPGYGQASPAPGYGQGSPSGYPAQGYGQGSPGVDSGSGWTASTGAGEPPKKGFIRRFWWLGCLLILLLVLILLVAGGIWLFSRDGGNEAGGGGGTTTSQEETTDGGESTEEETTEEPTEEPTEEETTEEVPTPTDLPTIDESAEPIEIVGMDGSGTMAVHMTYAPASELENTYGGTVAEPEFGEEYLVLTAKLTVTEGEMGLNPAQFDVITPYGGAVSRSSESYSLKGSGTGGPMDFTEGDEYTIRILFDVTRAGGNVLNFTTYTDDYTWDVPA